MLLYQWCDLSMATFLVRSLHLHPSCAVTWCCYDVMSLTTTLATMRCQSNLSFEALMSSVGFTLFFHDTHLLSGTFQSLWSPMPPSFPPLIPLTAKFLRLCFFVSLDGSNLVSFFAQSHQVFVVYSVHAFSGMPVFGIVSVTGSSEVARREVITVACCRLFQWYCASVWLEPSWNYAQTAPTCGINNCRLLLCWWYISPAHCIAVMFVNII